MQPGEPQTSGEPILTTASITALVVAVIAVLVAFGIPLTQEQQTAIIALVGVVAPFVVWAIARRFTTPTKNVAAVVDKTGKTVAGPASDVHNQTVVSVVPNPMG